MNTKKLLSIGLAVSTTAIASLTFAGDAPQTEQQREQKAVRIMSVANAVADQEGRYHHARALAVEGSSSISARANAWLAKEQAWIDGWTKALAFADLNTDIPLSVFQENLAHMLDAQSRAVVSLQAEAVKITQLGTDASAVMATSEKIPSGPETVSYDPIVAALTSRQGELRSMIATVSALPQQKVAGLASIDDASRRAIAAHVKAALLAHAKYPLVQALADVNALLAAEKVADPALARLEAAFTAMNDYNANLAYFHADGAIAPARKLCSDTKAAMAPLSAPKAFVDAANVNVDKYCSGIEKLYVDLTGDTSVSHADYVSAYLGGEKTKLKAVCAAASAGPACEKLALIASVSDADLTKMDDGQLRFLEMGWSAAMNRALGL
jgi:hypothetical protein